MYKNKGKRQFTEREKRAYSAGKGFVAAKAGKRITCKTEKEKQSFRNGVNAVRGKAAAQAKTSKAGGKKSKIVAGITADGVIVKV